MQAGAASFEMRQDGVLAVAGDLTFATVARAWHDGESQVRRDRPAALDLTAVGQVDSAGLALVLALLACACGSDAVLRVSNAPAALLALARVSDAEAWLTAAA